LGLLLLLFLCGVLCVGLRLWWVQFVAADSIRLQALTARRVVLPLPAARGALTDASGQPLARDRASFDVQVVPSTFRERSLLHALVDLRVLLDGRSGSPREGEGRSVEGLRQAARDDPARFVRWVLRVPTVRLTGARLAVSGESLCAAQGGDLIRAPAELSYRLRQCLGVLEGRGLAFRPQDLRRVSDRGGELGSAMGLSRDEVTARLQVELLAVEEVGVAIGHEAPHETWDAMDHLIRREIKWVDMHRRSEAMSLLSQERFGTPTFGPGSLPAEDYLAVARAARLPFLDDPAGRHAARSAVSGAAALLSGRLPSPTLGAPRRGDLIREEDGEDEDSLEEADRSGLFDLAPARVRDAWFRSTLGDRPLRDVLGARQDRTLRNRYRGGRAFIFGVGASAGVAALIVGPGRLQERGFRIVPGFVRDRELFESLSPTLQQLVGTVTTRGRTGASAAEAALQDRLSGVDGSVSVDRDGSIGEERRPADGDDVTLSFRRDVVRRLQEELPDDAPFGLAVVDVRNGAVVGLATGPVPTHAGEARAMRAQASRERVELRRARRLTRGAVLQELAFLEASAPLDGSPRMRRDILGQVARYGQDWIGTRLRELAMDGARSPAWHRAFELPGQCPPGSVFKAVTILEGLRSGRISADTTFDCGYETRTRRFHRCKQHGPALGITLALAKSCNEFCYQVGDRVGTTQMIAAYERLGLFDPIPGLSVQGPRRQLLTGANARNLAIGGGSLHCTPIRAAGIAASIARGRVVRPWLAGPPLPIGEPLVPAGSTWMLDEVRHGMREVCGPGGTARVHSAALRGLDVAAKTGTADHQGPGGEAVHEAWFVGYAPASDPVLAFAVVLPGAAADQPGARGVEGADAAPHAVEALKICAEGLGVRWW